MIEGAPDSTVLGALNERGISMMPAMGMNKNRWYDKDPHAAHAMELLQTFPPAVQTIIAKGVSLLADKEFKVIEMAKTYRTLGRDKVLSLHKAQRKLRRMDENPAVYKAVVHMSILSPAAQNFMVLCILELLELIGQYLKLCKQYVEVPKEDEVIKLTKAYVEEGSEEAVTFLKKIETAFIQKVQTRTKGRTKPKEPEAEDPSKAGSSPDTKIKVETSDRSGGMKIRDNM